MPEEPQSQEPSSSAEEEKEHTFYEENPFRAGSEAPWEESQPFESSPSAFPGGKVSVSLAMIRSWTKQHQKAAMIGAFAVGVFTGALLRD